MPPAPARRGTNRSQARCVVAVVLAAGEGRRLGGPKALLPVGGRGTGRFPVPRYVLLDYVLGELAAAGIEEVVVVAGARARDVLSHCDRPGVHGVENAHWRQGKTTSVRAGVEAALAIPGTPAGWFFIQGVDQPVSRAALRVLVQATAEAGRAGCAVLVPSYQGRRGHPLVVAAALAPELLTLREDNGGLRALRDRHPLCQVPVDDPSVLYDINRPEDVFILARLDSH